MELIRFWLRPDIQRKALEATQVEGAMSGMASDEFLKARPWYKA